MAKSFGSLDWDDIVSGKLSSRSEHIGKGVGKYAVMVVGTGTVSTHRSHAAATKAAARLKKQMDREGDDGEVRIVDLSSVTKRNYTSSGMIKKCKICGEAGHNARTCPSK